MPFTIRYDEVTKESVGGSCSVRLGLSCGGMLLGEVNCFAHVSVTW